MEMEKREVKVDIHQNSTPFFDLKFCNSETSGCIYQGVKVNNQMVSEVYGKQVENH